MTAESLAMRRSALAGQLPVENPASVQLREVVWPTLIELRIGTGQVGGGQGGTGKDGGGSGTDPVEAALGFRLPTGGRTSGKDGRLAIWLGPGWWLLDAPAADGPGRSDLEAPLVQELRAVGGPVSAVDVSAGFTVLELSGPDAPAVLAHGCSIDLHPRVFGPGRAARTMLAKAQVVLAQTDGGAPGSAPTYRIWVRSSFARYLTAWLLDAAIEYLT